MKDAGEIQTFIIGAVQSLLEPSETLGPDTVLVGRNAALSSILLVGLLVQLEDFCLEHGIPFDWTTDSAMSERRSRYRTVTTLTDYVMELQQSGENSQ